MHAHRISPPHDAARRPIRASLAGLLLAAAVAVPAQAQWTVHTTLDSFASAAGTIGLDTFDDLDWDAGFLAAPALRTAGTWSYAVTAPEGLFPGGSSADAWVSNYFVPDSLVLTGFSAAVRGVAGQFFLSNESGRLGAVGGLTVTVRGDAGTWTETWADASAPRFLGFTGTGSIASIELRAIGAVPEVNPIFATVNDLRLGDAPVTPVPEPASLALMLAGLGVVGWAARRRRRG